MKDVTFGQIFLGEISFPPPDTEPNSFTQGRSGPCIHQVLASSRAPPGHWCDPTIESPPMDLLPITVTDQPQPQFSTPARAMAELQSPTLLCSQFTIGWPCLAGWPRLVRLHA